jgi:hypothetical protein
MEDTNITVFTSQEKIVPQKERILENHIDMFKWWYYIKRIEVPNDGTKEDNVWSTES